MKIKVKEYQEVTLHQVVGVNTARDGSEHVDVVSVVFTEASGVVDVDEANIADYQCEAIAAGELDHLVEIVEEEPAKKAPVKTAAKNDANEDDAKS